MPTREQYEAAFEAERRNEYPVIDAFEKRMGFAVDRERLEAAARVLACPVKKNPPNWQHGRVVYALIRRLATQHLSLACIDVGTAKGFSAVCARWAMDDSLTGGVIRTFDIIDPESTEPRNSVEDGKAVHEFVQPYAAADTKVLVVFYGQSVKDWAGADTSRHHFAFIDGSHQYEGVKADIAVVAPRQQSGDIILFDDVNKEQVNRAVREMDGYDLEYIRLLPQRAYAIAVKQ